MKVAFLHLEFSGGPVEDNLKKICLAIIKAAESGAKFIVTPEIALQGYFFSEKADNLETVLVPNVSIDAIKNLAKEYQVIVFLCCAEMEENTGYYYNSCQVISSEGEVISKQHKMSGHTIGAEAWSKKGDKFLPVQIGEEQRDRGDHQAHSQTPRRAAADEAQHDDDVGQGRDQHFLDVTLELGTEE